MRTKKEKESLEKVESENKETNELVQIDKKVLGALEEGTKIFRDEKGRYFIKKNKEQSKETFLFEDSSKGTRLILESESCSMPQLISFGLLTNKEFSKGKNLRREYIQ